MTSAPAIGFEYRPSRTLAWLVVGMSMLATIAVLFCALAWWWKILLLMAMVVSLLCATRHRDAPQSASWSPESGWSLRLCDGREVPAILRSWRVMGSCVLLQLQRDRTHRYALWLLPDNSDADTRRRLRMRLVSGVLEESAEAD